MGNIVAIVGRPNVGKSTLFNRLVGERIAIINNTPGVTRDRIYGSCFWNGKNFTVVDTGGFIRNSADIFEAAIREQVKIAVQEARAIVFMVDVTTGITDLDEEVATLLRKSKKPVFLAVNKADNVQLHLEANEFWSLGFEQTFFVSSISGSGSGELLDAVAEVLPNDEEESSEEEGQENRIPRITIVGQPNVGKSSLTNALLGEERNIVTDIAGTTRDSIDTVYNKFGKEFLLVDTAGIRKKGKVHEDLEFYSVMRAINALERSDVCVIMIDAQTGMEAQDMNILRLAERRRKGAVIVVNKWDLVEKETNTARDYEEELKKKIAPFNDIPILFVSVLDKQRIYRVVETALEVYDNRRRSIRTSELNDVMLAAIERYQPPAHRGHSVKIKYVTQLKAGHPAFAFFCNHPKHVKENYRNYLENQLRKHFTLTGSPISIFFRQK